MELIAETQSQDASIPVIQIRGAMTFCAYVICNMLVCYMDMPVDVFIIERVKTNFFPVTRTFLLQIQSDDSSKVNWTNHH